MSGWFPSSARPSALALGMTLSLAACGGADETITAWQAEEGGAEVEASGDSPLPRAGAMGPEVEANLQRAKDQWATAGADDYTLKVKRSCFCPGDDVLVVVRDGQVARAHSGRGDGIYDIEIDAAEYRDWYTVDGMFARIEGSLSVADYLEVEYDSNRGFPALSAFDYTLASADEGEVFKMWDFVADEAE